MVKKEQLKELGSQFFQINQEFEQSNEVKGQTKITRDVVLFFSFDVVNSSSYKTINYYGWALALNDLFKTLREDVRNKISGSEMWRVLGDEAIFILKIKDEEELRTAVDNIYKILTHTIKDLKQGRYFEKIGSKKEVSLMKLQNILSLQAAAWIATVTNIGDIDNNYPLEDDIDNIFEKYKSQEGYEIFEFLGNDIDTGFRISKQTCDGRLVVSFELAYLISQEKESSSYLHIITYKKLKGVWKEKLYPIIWYHNPKRLQEIYDNEISLEASFSFDACDDYELIKEYYDNRNPQKETRIIRDLKMYTDINYALNKILNDRNLKDKISKLKTVLQNTHDTTKYISTEWLQLHCVAVCYSLDKNIKILVAKRAENRKRFPGQWEFGCAKATLDKTISQKIKEEYKQDFQIDISPVLDVTRTIQEPLPIAIYQVESTDSLTGKTNKHKGIITLAKITGHFDITEFKKTAKHEELKWITEEDLEKLGEKFSEHVPDFEQTLKSSFKKIKELHRIEVS